MGWLSHPGGRARSWGAGRQVRKDVLVINNDGDILEGDILEVEKRRSDSDTTKSPVVTAGEHPPCRDRDDGQVVKHRPSTGDEPGVNFIVDDLVTVLLWQRSRARTTSRRAAVPGQLPLLVPLFPGLADPLVVKVLDLFPIKITAFDL